MGRTGSRIPSIGAAEVQTVSEYETIHYDETVHRTTSTSYKILHELKNADYDYRVGICRVEYNYRTTGSATAYVCTDVYQRRCNIVNKYTISSNTTSTTTVSISHNYFSFQVFYGSDTSSTVSLKFETSDSSVEAEVSMERVTVIWGRLVKP